MIILETYLEPLYRNPQLSEITLRLRDSLQDVYIVDNFLYKLHQLVREWVNILRGAENCPKLNALRSAIAPHTIYPVLPSDLAPSYSDDSEPVQ